MQDSRSVSTSPRTRAALAALAVLVAASASAKPFDFDGDGRADVLWRNGSHGHAALWRMAGTTAVSTHFVLSDNAWIETQVGDFNNDGRADIVWRNVRTGWTALWLMNGSVPTATAILMTDPAWEATHVGDFDGDRRADLVWRHATTGATAIWIMNGTQVTTSRIVQSDPSWRVTHVADADGNGRADLVWRKADSGETSLWLMNGAAASSTGQVVKSVDWIVTHAADFNGDGRADLVARNVKTGGTAIWLQSGLTRIGGSTVFTDLNWLVEFTGDFNGDGRADLLWRHARTGVTAVWLMNGAALVTANTLLSSGQWRVVQVADFDGDTRDDLLWVNHELGGTSLWLMNGAVRGAAQYLLGDRQWVPTSVADRTRLLGHSTAAARDAARLMAQATFGTTPAEVARAQSIGHEAWINDQIAKPQTTHLPWVRAEMAAGREGWEVMVPSLWRSWFEGSDQLRQRVALALSEILVVSVQKTRSAPSRRRPRRSWTSSRSMRSAISARCWESVTLHPTMGYYLDMIGSGKDDVRGVRPNENYARELLQLFSIGLCELNVDGTPKRTARGAIPTYSEDVVQASRARSPVLLARQDEANADSGRADAGIIRKRQRPLGGRCSIGRPAAAIRVPNRFPRVRPEDAARVRRRADRAAGEPDAGRGHLLGDGQLLPPPEHRPVHRPPADPALVTSNPSPATSTASRSVRQQRRRRSRRSPRGRARDPARPRGALVDADPRRPLRQGARARDQVRSVPSQLRRSHHQRKVLHLGFRQPGRLAGTDAAGRALGVQLFLAVARTNGWYRNGQPGCTGAPVCDEFGCRRLPRVLQLGDDDRGFYRTGSDPLHNFLIAMIRALHRVGHNPATSSIDSTTVPRRTDVGRAQARADRRDLPAHDRQRHRPARPGPNAAVADPRLARPDGAEMSRHTQTRTAAVLAAAASCRRFVKRAAALAATTPFLGDLSRVALAAGPYNDYRALVSLLVRRHDAHNTVVPLEAASASTSRNAATSLFRRRSSSVGSGVVAGRTFGFHPSLAQLAGMFTAGKAAVVGTSASLAAYRQGRITRQGATCRHSCFPTRTCRTTGRAADLPNR